MQSSFIQELYKYEKWSSNVLLSKKKTETGFFWYLAWKMTISQFNKETTPPYSYFYHYLKSS